MGYTQAVGYVSNSTEFEWTFKVFNGSDFLCMVPIYEDTIPARYPIFSGQQPVVVTAGREPTLKVYAVRPGALLRAELRSGESVDLRWGSFSHTGLLQLEKNQLSVGHSVNYGEG